MNRWIVVYRSAWGALITIGIIGAIFICLPQVRKMQAMQRTKTQYQQANQELTDGIETFKEKQERFSTDPKYVERTARDIGMVKPNETIFTFTNSSPRVDL